MTAMRKSRYISLLLAGAAAIPLAACDDANTTGSDATLYADAGACAQDFDVAACEAAELAAKAEHAAQAPKFATKEQCEASGFSTCEAAPTTAAANQATTHSGGFFMPMMMGYMMGRMMGGPVMGAPAPAPGKAAWSGASRPVYADRAGYLYAGGANVGRMAPGTTSLGRTGLATRTVARGGFGGTAGRIGGGA